MKNRKSIYFIVAISLFVGLLHFVFGPDYQGAFRHFIRGYLIDILLPMNLYLLLQVSLRKRFAVNKARMIAAIVCPVVGTTVEVLQFYGYPVFGRTYDPWDIAMYVIGTGLGFLIDICILDRFEKQGAN